jgi:hypothetical protein
MGYKYNRTLIVGDNEDLLEFVNDLNLVLLAQNKDKREFCLTHKVSLIRYMGECRKINLESYVAEPIEPKEQMDLEELKSVLIDLYENLDGYSNKYIREILKEIIENV